METVSFVTTAFFVLGKRRCRAKTLARWALLLAAMPDDDSDSNDDPRVKRCSTVNPSPAYSA